MKRVYLCLALGLIGLASVFGWSASHANDNETSAPDDQNLQLIDKLDLIARIEQLEKRIGVLEDRDSLIRQADNREPSAIAQPEKFTPVPSIPESELPSITAEENEEDDVQSTNGQKWSFRLLRQPSVRRPSMLIPNHVRRVEPTKRASRSPEA